MDQCRYYNDSQQAANGRHFDEIEEAKKLLLQLRSSGRARRTDIEFGDETDQLMREIVRPKWFNQKLFENAKLVYERHFMAVNLAHLLGLILLVRVSSIFNTLSSTGKSISVGKLFRRYVSTMKHVKSWYEQDIFEPGSEANRSLLAVRTMHDSVSQRLNGKSTSIYQDGKDKVTTCTINNNESPNERNYHLSEYDIMLTQFAFLGLIVLNPRKMGLMCEFSEYDLESMLHFWRIIGHLLGATDRYNLCTRTNQDVRNLCKAILEIEMIPSLKLNSLATPQGIMSINIVRSLDFIPMISVYGAIRLLYDLIGWTRTDRDRLEIKKFGNNSDRTERNRNYTESGQVENLGKPKLESQYKDDNNNVIDKHETELDYQVLKNHASAHGRLGYALMHLVTNHILAIGFMRSFNNGLTRLSLWFIQKCLDWNERRLRRTYGETLRL